jgi:hypothetical protein
MIRRTEGVRLSLSDDFISATVKLADGNPGAAAAIMEMAKNEERIDPDSLMGIISPLLSLDSNGIYGSRIWCLYQDCAGRDPAKALALLRATQLGILDRGTLDCAIDHRGDGIDVDAIMAKVQERLPRFNAPPPASLQGSRDRETPQAS